jgi:hypothetical protein
MGRALGRALVDPVGAKLGQFEQRAAGHRRADIDKDQ